MHQFILETTALGSGFFWLIAYILIIYRGLKDKSYGMPIVALCGNFGWEVIFGLGIESGCPISWKDCPESTIQIRNFIWLLLDILILYTILKYGRKYFSGLFKKYFFTIVLMSIVLASFIVYFTVQEFYALNKWGVEIGGTIPKTLPLKVQGGSYYTGFILNLIMSIVYVFMHLNRQNMDGQSFQIALNKWLGTLAAYLFMIASNTHNPLVHTLYAGIFIFDVIYMLMMFNDSKSIGKNPWTRA